MISGRNSWRQGFLGAGREQKTAASQATGDPAAAAVDGMLNYIASFSPKHLLREITERCESLEQVWRLLRKWAGIQESGLKILEYSRLQLTWDPAGEISPSEFYYSLLDTMQDVLLVKNGQVKYENKDNAESEDMTPTLRSMVVKDWLVMGGQQLFEHVCRVYSKDLEIATLADIQHRVAQNLDCLNSELESVSGAVKAMKIFSAGRNNSFKQRRPTRVGPKSASQANKRNPPPSMGKSTLKRRHCILCEAMGRSEAMLTHSLATCYLVDKDDRVEMAKIQRSIVADDAEDEDNCPSDEISTEED